MTNGYPECNVSEETFLLLHVYPGLLLLLTLVYGIAVFRIKRNFNEGRWVTCATVCIIPGELLIDPPTNILVRSDSLIPVFVAWALVFYFAPTSLHDPSIAVAIVAIAGLLLTTIFLPKMHTISQQSKYRKLKLHSPGSDSTVYTSYTAQQDFPSYSMYYPPNALYPGTGGELITEIFGCQASVYPPQGTTHTEDYIPTYEHTWAPAPLPTSTGSTASTTWPDRSTPGDDRDFIAEWKSLTCTSCFSATTTYADWSREQTPGYHQTQHHQHHQHHQQAAHNHWKKMVSINPNISTGAGPTSSR